MCVVADPPTFIPMFKSADPEHQKFKPVIDWVMAGPGKFVMGGSKYNEELRAIRSILSHLSELEKMGKIIRKPEADVDEEESLVKVIEPDRDFDDPHLVALIRLTGCRLICVRDPRSHKFLLATYLYRSSKDRPKLYTGAKRNSTLLITKNIGACCR